MSKLAASAHAPFITGASPSVMQMESWQELANPRDLTKIFTTPEYAAWRSLRESDDARYLAMCMPRFLARLPYGAKTSPVDEFDFEEDTAGATHAKYSWANAAYAMAVNVNRSFKTYGWCSRIRGIESGGAVENLPTHSFPSDDGGVDMKCPTEIAISDRREAELSKNGFLSMIHRKNSDFAAFISGQSLQKPQEYDDPDATANAALAARLPYLFACNRFAHYLKCIVRDKVGSFRSREAMQNWLNEWILNYVDGDPAQLERGHQGQAAARRGAGRGRGNRRRARLLPVEVLSETALPARRPDGVFAPGLQATVGEDGLSASAVTLNRRVNHGSQCIRQLLRQGRRRVDPEGQGKVDRDPGLGLGSRSRDELDQGRRRERRQAQPRQDELRALLRHVVDR